MMPWPLPSFAVWRKHARHLQRRRPGADPGYDPGIPPAWKRPGDHELVLEGVRKTDWAAGVLMMPPILVFTFFVRN
jgi:hypothetical protein